ncbi:Cyclin-dependent kinase 11B [Balamuthia mandrillaris]
MEPSARRQAEDSRGGAAGEQEQQHRKRRSASPDRSAEGGEDLTQAKRPVSKGKEAEPTASHKRSKTETTKAPQPIVDFRRCRRVDDIYEPLNRVQEGAYGVVHRALDKETGEIYALKKFKISSTESFPVTSLREISVLMSCDHPNIVKAREVVVGKDTNSFYLVMEFLEHDLKDLMEAMKDPFLPSEVKCLLLQLLEGISYLHENWYLHRDLKTSNLLLSNKGILKIADFGLARHFGSPLKSYTQPVVTLWYRAPELLLGEKNYSWAVDMWSVGCIFAEMLLKVPLFKGKSELEQIDKIFRVLGTPDEQVWPDYPNLPYPKRMKFRRYPRVLRETLRSTTTEAGFDLLSRMLHYDPAQRITATEALQHPYFRESPPPRDPDMIQTYPSLHEGKKLPRRGSPGEEGGLFGSGLLADTLDEATQQLGLDQFGQQAAGFTLRF